MDIAEAISVEIPGPGPVDYYNVASRLLEVAADALDTLVVYGLRGCPGRAYVAPGLPAFDCEQLTVHGAALFEQLTNPYGPEADGQRAKFGRINLVTFTTSIVRCLAPLPNENSPPDPISEDIDARQVLADARVIWETYFARARNNTLLGGDTCAIRKLEASHPSDPSGGFGGWLIQTTVQIDGYNPLVGS